MQVSVEYKGPVRGACELPTDKAVCHRALLIGAVAEGNTEMAPWPDAEDCARTRALIESCGVRTRLEGDTLRVEGRGAGALKASRPLDCGESGTTLRLAVGLLAGQRCESQLIAAPSLARRPMRRVVEPLRRMGADIEGRPGERAGEIYPPLLIKGGSLQGIAYEPEVASAQVKSAVLLAGLNAGGSTSVVERAATRDHTERMLRCFGLDVREEGLKRTLTPGPLRSPGSLRLPGDVSSAAFFVVAAACIPDSELVIREVGLNPTRAHFIALLRRMGAAIEVRETATAWEPRGEIRVRGGSLKGIELTAGDIPQVIDELPILMVAAAAARGRSRFPSLHELRVKETDRVQSMTAGLSAMGARLALPDAGTVDIEGGPLKGAPVEGFGDHRTVMSLAVAGLLARGRTEICGAECVAKSFPDFFSRLAALLPEGSVRAA